MSNKMTRRSNLCIQKIELGELTCALCIVCFTAGMWHRIVMLAKPWGEQKKKKKIRRLLFMHPFPAKCVYDFQCK